MVACKPKSFVAEEGANKSLTAEKVVAGHNKIKKDFSTVYIKANVKYKDDRQAQNVTAEIRIKKDETILISARFIGITMAKAIITPDGVKYYEKIGGKFFEGDFTTLSRWLGTDLDFDKVQNMLLGDALDDLTKDKYHSEIDNGLYKLERKGKDALDKAFYFEAANFLLKKQEVTQVNPQRELYISYPNHKEYKEAILPVNVIIEAFYKGKTTNISLDYNNVTFNEQLSFPYSVPEGYERIFID